MYRGRAKSTGAYDAKFILAPSVNPYTPGGFTVLTGYPF